MKLTETQRDFLTKTLGIKPSGKGLLQRRTTEEKRGDTATEAFNDYLGREAKVLEAVRELEKVPGTQKLVAGYEKQIGEIQARVKGATKDDADTVIKKAYKDLEDIKTQAQSEAATYTKNAEYYTALDEARRSLDELRKHAQQGRAKQQINAADADLANADRKAAAGKFKEARPLVDAAKQKITEGKQLADDHAQYETELAEAQGLIDTLKSHAQKDSIPTHIDAAEKDLAKAKKLGKEGKLKDGRVAIESAKQKTAQATKVADDYAQYEAEKTAVQLLVDDLKKHAQKQAIATEIADIESDLTKANTKAKAGKVKEARDAVAAVKKKCEDAKKTADDYAAYALKRAAAVALIFALRGISDALDTYLNTQNAEITKGDTEAGPGKRDFAKAAQLVDAVTTNLAGMLKRDFVTNVKPKIKALKDKNSTFVTDDVKEIDTLQAEVETSLANREWRKVLLTGARVTALLTNSNKLADRSKGYADQKVVALKAIDGLKTKPVLANQIPILNKLVEHADGLAARETMRPEDGIRELKDIENSCAALLKMAPEAEAYNAERKTADDKMAALSKHSAAGNLGEVLPAIKQQLDLAAKLAGDANQPGRLDAGAQDYKEARAVLARVTVDLNNAAKLADQAKDMQDTASGAGKDPDAVRKAIAKLRKQAEAIAKGEHADQVKDELGKVKKALDDAEAQVKAGKPEATAAPLKSAADLLATAQAVETQQGRFLELRADIEKRQKAVSKLPVAEEIKAKIKSIETALAEADEKAGTRSWPEATERIEVALQATDAAERAAKSRQEYDDRVKSLTADFKKADNKGALSKKERKDIQDALKAAEGQAKGLQFDQAKGSLDLVENRLEALSVNKLAKATPPDPALLADSAKKMMAKGGGKVLDDLVKGLPNDVPFAVIAALAKERFKIELKSDAGTETRSAKKIWEMLAKVPEDVIGNPSLKEVRREEPGKNGGFYRSSEDLVVMNGRPGQYFQTFGANLKDGDGKPQLPNKVDPDCKPENDKQVDYFDFATLHEVGHSVDDSTQFMATKEGKEPFGGWKTYGGKVEPIAEAVAKWTGYDSTPEQKKYVLDLILGNKTEPPTPTPDKKATWDAGLKKVDDWHKLATNEAIWWQQGNSDKIAIDGVVYQEAYKRTWVSYLAKARSQGITGYQFRAPGEWFAELYASYRIGKLKKSHPAQKWLSTISI